MVFFPLEPYYIIDKISTNETIMVIDDTIVMKNSSLVENSPPFLSLWKKEVNQNIKGYFRLSRPIELGSELMQSVYKIKKKS